MLKVKCGKTTFPSALFQQASPNCRPDFNLDLQLASVAGRVCNLLSMPLLAIVGLSSLALAVHLPLVCGHVGVAVAVATAAAAAAAAVSV